MKKLLHISPNSYPELEIDHHSKRIWTELAKGIDEYHLLARSRDNKYRYSKEGAMHLHLVPKIFKKSRIFFVSSLWMFYLIQKYKITHLLSQCPLVGGVTGILASKVFNIPIMLEIHGDIYFNYLKGKSFNAKLISRILKYALYNATRIRSLSNAMTGILNDFGIKNNIVLIPNRVDLSLFDNPKESFDLGNPITIVSVGRFVEQKGFDIAIESIKDISEKYSIKLILIGGGQLYDNLLKLTRGYNNMELKNWMDQAGLKSILSDTDIYIQPSRSEAMPRTILEAMAMRLPIISTNIAAIPGILQHGKNALLIDPDNKSALTDAIESLIHDPELRTRISNQALSDVKEKYEWNKVFEIYRNALLNMETGRCH